MDIYVSALSKFNFDSTYEESTYSVISEKKGVMIAGADKTNKI